jgi:hypothetical protein
MMKYGLKWAANVHHYAYRSEMAFLKGDRKLRHKHLSRLYALIPESYVDTKRMEEIVQRAIRQAHKDFREDE